MSLIQFNKSWHKIFNFFSFMLKCCPFNYIILSEVSFFKKEKIKHRKMFVRIRYRSWQTFFVSFLLLCCQFNHIIKCLEFYFVRKENRKCSSRDCLCKTKKKKVFGRHFETEHFECFWISSHHSSDAPTILGFSFSSSFSL